MCNILSYFKKIMGAQQDQEKIPPNMIYRVGRYSHYAVQVEVDKGGKIIWLDNGRPAFFKKFQLKNKNDTADLINQYKKNGCMKNCVNLFNKSDTGYFIPICTQHSLNWISYPQSENALLYGCPKNCHYYERSWWRKFKNCATACRQSIRNFIKSAFNKFIAMPKWVQGFLFLLLFIHCLPQDAISQVIAIYKEIKE